MTKALAMQIAATIAQSVATVLRQRGLPDDGHLSRECGNNAAAVVVFLVEDRDVAEVAA
jgi:hypothetical protein